MFKNAWDSISIKTVKFGLKKCGSLAYDDDNESEESGKEHDKDND